MGSSQERSYGSSETSVASACPLGQPAAFYMFISSKEGSCNPPPPLTWHAGSGGPLWCRHLSLEIVKAERFLFICQCFSRAPFRWEWGWGKLHFLHFPFELRSFIQCLFIKNPGCFVSQEGGVQTCQSPGGDFSVHGACFFHFFLMYKCGKK